MSSEVIGHISLPVVGIGYTAVVLVRDGEHPMGSNRKLGKSECPVGIVVGSGEIL